MEQIYSTPGQGLAILNKLDKTIRKFSIVRLVLNALRHHRLSAGLSPDCLASPYRCTQRYYHSIITLSIVPHLCRTIHQSAYPRIVLQQSSTLVELSVELSLSAHTQGSSTTHLIVLHPLSVQYRTYCRTALLPLPENSSTKDLTVPHQYLTMNVELCCRTNRWLRLRLE